MVTLRWCLTQKRGIAFVEPNEILCKEYFREAQQTLQEIHGQGSKWDVIMAYYACYHALYALLQKAGIKSEIHDCTLEIMKLMDGFTREDYAFLTKLKEQRIKAQYYLKEERLQDLSQVKTFVLKCRTIAEQLDPALLHQRLNHEKK